MYTATKSNQITLHVYYDESDPQNRGWSYRQYDGHPKMGQDSLALVESGPVTGRQTTVRPSRARVLASAGVQDGPYVHVRCL